MEHLDPDVLAAMADGRMTGSDLERAERHLCACSTCRKELSALASMRSGAADTVRANPSTSVLASIRPARTIAMRPRAALAPEGSQRALVLRDKLGEGGMAVVYAALQTALDREVAVKTARDGDTDAEQALVEEARITGALEHPNIVPVHDVGRDDRGRPLIVLKRIEGTPWSETIAKATLESNLEQLMHVCRAVSFAHSRGILHRDLKPSNVMIGEFGETYVLDWGIAVPLESKSDEVAGTLAYMAPEMLEGETLTVRADVYLLGATLYEILAGQPPHVASSITESMHSIARSTPVLPAGVPEELAAIVRRAMTRDPAQRFASVDELRHAVMDFLGHRRSAEVARGAHDHLAALQAHLARGGERIDAYQRFGQCRFGFEEALRTWPDNSEARVGLERAVSMMAGYELAQGDVRAASLLVAELRGRYPELVAKLELLEREQAAKSRSLEALARDHDASIGGGMRTLFGVLFGLVWAVLPLAASRMPGIDIDHPTSLAVGSGSLLLFVTAIVLARRSLLVTAVNRGAVISIVLALAMHVLFEALAWALGLDMVTTHTIALAMWCGACGIAAVFLDRSLVLPTAGFFAALVVALRWPELRFWAISASLAAFALTLGYAFYASRCGRPASGLAEMFKSSD